MTVLRTNKQYEANVCVEASCWISVCINHCSVGAPPE